MKFTTIIALALASATTTFAAPTTTFPSDIQISIQNLQLQIQNVILDYATGVPVYNRNTDYSSTGRSLDYFLRNTFLPNGPTSCPQANQPLPPQATTTDQGIGYMQQAQLALIAVSQDAINNDFTQAQYDICQVVRNYGGAALSTSP